MDPEAAALISQISSLAKVIGNFVKQTDDLQGALAIIFSEWASDGVFFSHNDLARASLGAALELGKVRLSSVYDVFPGGEEQVIQLSQQLLSQLRQPTPKSVTDVKFVRPNTPPYITGSWPALGDEKSPFHNPKVEVATPHSRKRSRHDERDEVQTPTRHATTGITPSINRFVMSGGSSGFPVTPSPSKSPTRGPRAWYADGAAQETPQQIKQESTAKETFSSGPLTRSKSTSVDTKVYQVGKQTAPMHAFVNEQVSAIRELRDEECTPPTPSTKRVGRKNQTH